MTVADEPGTQQPQPTTTQPIAKVSRSTSLHVPNATILVLPSATPESPAGSGPTEMSNTDDDNGGQGGGDDTSVADTALNSEEEILIYTAIGVAVFLFLVVFLLVVCVCLWNSVFRQSKYCTICGSSPY